MWNIFFFRLERNVSYDEISYNELVSFSPNHQDMPRTSAAADAVEEGINNSSEPQLNATDMHVMFGDLVNEI